MTGEGAGHAALAGAVGAGAIACGAVVGPLVGTVFELAAAAATAGIAAHAVEVSARERGVSPAGILHRTARAAVRRSDAPLAAHAVDVACRARKGDARALRSAAILLGRATTAHARGIAMQLLGACCPSTFAPLRNLVKVTAPVEAARAALECAAFVREMVSALPERQPLVPAACSPVTGRSPHEWAFVGTFGDGSPRDGEPGAPGWPPGAAAETWADAPDWEVAA